MLFYAKYPEESTGQHNLVLIHGAGGSHLYWPAALRRLAGVNVYALDLPAHGRSGGGTRITLSEYAATVHRFVLTLGLPCATVLGHSMGGGIALLLALHRLPWLEKVILLGSAARLHVPADILESLNPRRGKEDFEKALDLVSQRIYGPRADHQLRWRGRQLLRAASPAVLYADYLACAQFDCSAQVGTIALPTLVICGDADQMVAPEASCGLSQQIPHAQLVIIRGAGHMLMLEKPVEVAEAVARFLGVV
ncbi:MAG: alpha/beta hydrolase [Anaerolineae bacterium]|nr:alpha/beta hydrolase [Anaerolineae bacterium]